MLFKRTRLRRKIRRQTGSPDSSSAGYSIETLREAQIRANVYRGQIVEYRSREYDRDKSQSKILKGEFVFGYQARPDLLAEVDRLNKEIQRVSRNTEEMGNDVRIYKDTNANLSSELRDTAEILKRTRRELSEKYGLAAALEAQVEALREVKRESVNERRRLVRRIENLSKGPKLSEVQQELLVISETHLPAEVVEAAKEIVTDRSMSDALQHLMDRIGEFTSKEEMLLVGIGLNPMARRHFGMRLDEMWAKERSVAVKGTAPGTVIFGSGIHGAIAAAVRHKKTGQRPAVFEQRDRAGGSFAVSAGPSFFLNSRNRPGPLSIPGDEFGALNVLPGAPIQPSQISGGEYISNDAMAWAIRSTLLMHADVHTGLGDVQISGSADPRVVYSRSREYFYPSRVIMARGLGVPRVAYPNVYNNPRYVDYNEFMSRMDDPFPFRGIKRVAVLGAGDGGKTVIEALVGQGPSTSLSMPSLDFPDVIDWYGVQADRRTREAWEACNRSRYKGLGRVVGSRVACYDAPTFVYEGYDAMRINGLPYDLVVDATGYTSYNPIEGFYFENERVIGGRSSYNSQIYYVGPTVNLDFTTEEATYPGAQIVENKTSIYRYAERTARLAEVI